MFLRAVLMRPIPLHVGILTLVAWFPHLSWCPNSTASHWKGCPCIFTHSCIMCDK